MFAICLFSCAVVNGEQENRIQKGNGYFQVPPHTPVIFGEAGGRTLFRYSQIHSEGSFLILYYLHVSCFITVAFVDKKTKPAVKKKKKIF